MEILETSSDWSSLAKCVCTLRQQSAVLANSDAYLHRLITCCLDADDRSSYAAARMIAETAGFQALLPDVSAFYMSMYTSMQKFVC